ncbi:fused response regulator/phosphatase [Isoptericola sp. 4D.3]|uniref:Fused response regulator/phosphatase n=1 Tax=Isoptericola peretonis TaxID=2918523 RepID=A0ABT0J7I5_9MICO|nr:fused response regulator/phosphatase [Isoptericola sp. 4D.3]
MTHTDRRVLVVDDTRAHRYVMATWLRGAGFDVVEAATGAEALDLVDPSTDAVVLDVNLPDLTGTEVCHRIKADESTAHVPVLHVSATSVDAAARTAGLEGGADAYLPEPLDRDEFLATVGALCRTHDAQRGAGRTARRLEALADALAPLHQARTQELVADLVAQGACSVLGRAAVAMVVVDPQTVVRAVCAGEDSPLVRGRGSVPVLPPGPVSSATFGPDQVPEHWQPLLARAGVPRSTWWTVWLRDAEGALVGGLAIQADDAEQGPSAEEREVADRFTEAITVALANLRTFAEEHRIAVALQRRLLPSGLAVRGGLEVAARYDASDARLDVGGDFYDAFDLPDGRVAVVIGDVQGHSLRAATVMAEVRIMLRAYLREGHEAARALDLLNASLEQDHPELATVCVCVIDPSDGTVEMTDAGHLPPVVVRADGSVTAEKSPARLLGLASPDERPARRDRLGPGDLLVLVTDGLVERRDRTLRDGMRELVGAAATLAGLAPEEACARLVDAFDDAAREDDVAVVAVRLGAPQP